MCVMLGSRTQEKSKSSHGNCDASESCYVSIGCITSAHISLAKAWHMAKSKSAMQDVYFSPRKHSKTYGNRQELLFSYKEKGSDCEN